jgi:hypothetical protein
MTDDREPIFDFRFSIADYTLKQKPFLSHLSSLISHLSSLPSLLFPLSFILHTFTANAIVYNSKYAPRWRSNSSCVPSSMMRPLSITTILSARVMVDKRCAMTNDGATFEQAFERRLNDALGLRVHRRGCLVENQDARIGEERARERNQLALTAGQNRAAFTDQRIVTLVPVS